MNWYQYADLLYWLWIDSSVIFDQNISKISGQINLAGPRPIFDPIPMRIARTTYFRASKVQNLTYKSKDIDFLYWLWIDSDMIFGQKVSPMASKVKLRVVQSIREPEIICLYECWRVGCDFFNYWDQILAENRVRMNSQSTKNRYLSICRSNSESLRP